MQNGFLFCSKCGNVVERFKRGRRCQACMLEDNRRQITAWKKRHPEQVLESIRKASFKRLYGITPEQARELYGRQEGKCALCLKSIPFDGRERAIDHDHVTGRVRGILCRTCNQTLGHLEKQAGSFAAWVRRAAAYLKD